MTARRSTCVMPLGIAMTIRGRNPNLVTDVIGLVTLLIAIMSALTVRDHSLSDRVGSSAPVLIVLGAALIGGMTGSLLRIEDRLEGLGGWLQRRLGGERRLHEDRDRFVEGFVSARQFAARQGQSAAVFVDVPGRGRMRLGATLTFVSPEVNPVNGQVLIWAEVDNRELVLKPGQTATLEIESDRPIPEPTEPQSKS